MSGSPLYIFIFAPPKPSSVYSAGKSFCAITSVAVTSTLILKKYTAPTKIALLSPFCILLFHSLWLQPSLALLLFVSLRFTFPPAGGTECSGSAEREFLSLRPTRVVWPFELNFIISVVLCMHTQLLLILPLQRVEICAAHQTQLLHNVYSNWINDTKIFILPKHRGCLFIKSYFH